MSDSENDGDHDNPFVVSSNPGDIGCNSDYISGGLEWTEEMTATATTDEKIVQLCVNLLQAHNAGESLFNRQEWLKKALTAQYNTPALGHYARYFGIQPPAKGPWLRRDILDALIKNNIPFLPWDIYHGMLAEAKATYEDQILDDLPPVDTTALYEAFCLEYPFGGVKGPRKKGDAASTASSAANANATALVYAAAFKKASPPGQSGLTKSQKMMFDKEEVVDEDALAEAEQRLKRKAMATLQHRQSMERADADFARQVANDFSPPSKRPKEVELDDDDPRPISGLLAHDNF